MAAEHWRPAYVALGSNLDEPLQQLRAAVVALGAVAGSAALHVSSAWQSKPHGPQDQPDFVNAVVAFLTMAGPEDLLGELQRIERAHGRERDGRRWGPRTLDLDLLLLGRLRVDTASLTLPHPRIGERAFVLAPLAELAPTLDVPGLGGVRAASQAVSDPSLQRLGAL